MAVSGKYGKLNIPQIGGEEPVFILRAQDKLAEIAIEMYRLLAASHGCPIAESLQKEIEKHYTRQELRRAAFADVGSITYPVRAPESYAADLLSSVDVEAIRSRRFRLVIDYGYSAASFVLPLVLAPLGVETISANEFSTDQTDRES